MPGALDYLNEELAKIDAYYLGHKDVKGMYAVDAGSTQGVAQVMQKYGLRRKGVRAGGYDLLPTILRLIQAGHMDFTIDQQPYLQGWLPVLQLWWYKYSSGLVAPSDTNTGILFVTRANVRPYLTTKTRYGVRRSRPANAIPSPSDNPCPNEPVAASTPATQPGLGCSAKGLPGKA